MRKINVTPKKQRNLRLKSTPKKYEWVEKIAKQYAGSLTELERLYLMGLKVFKKVETKMDAKTLKRFSVFIVRQAILKKVKNKY